MTSKKTKTATDVSSRVQSLRSRHQKLEADIKAMSLRSGHCSIELRKLKVQKLKLKDELASLGCA